MKNYSEYTLKDLLDILKNKEETSIIILQEIAKTENQSEGWMEYKPSIMMLTEEAKIETVKKSLVIKDMISYLNYFILRTYQEGGIIKYKNINEKDCIMKITFP